MSTIIAIAFVGTILSAEQDLTFCDQDYICTTQKQTLPASGTFSATFGEGFIITLNSTTYSTPNWLQSGSYYQAQYSEVGSGAYSGYLAQFTGTPNSFKGLFETTIADDTGSQSYLWRFTSAPEPATWTLWVLGSGLCGLALRRQRSGRSALGSGHVQNRA